MKLMRLIPLLLFLALTNSVDAQLDTNFAESQTNLTVAPEFPRPGEPVQVTFSNYSSIFAGSEMIWQVDGVVITDAKNQRSVDLIAGNLGDTSTVSVTVTRRSGGAQTYAIEIVPTYIDIVLEAQTRVPDFYQGRATPSVGSQVNATAVINNGRIVEGDYLYTWRLNNQVLTGGPIRGTNKVSFDTPRGSQPILSLHVADTLGNTIAQKSIYFNSVQPHLVFYELNPLLGQSHIAIDDRLILVDGAATIIAEPYNLDIRHYNSPDINEWEIDRVTQTNTGRNPYRITVQQLDEGGVSRASFHVRSTSELLQGARGSIDIVF